MVHIWRLFRTTFENNLIQISTLDLIQFGLLEFEIESLVLRLEALIYIFWFDLFWESIFYLQAHAWPFSNLQRFSKNSRNWRRSINLEQTIFSYAFESVFWTKIYF